VVGVACLTFWATVSVLGRLANVRNRARLEDLIRARAVTPAVPRAHGRAAAGELLGRVDLARVGISTVVLEGTDERELEQAAGHIPGTALPGEDGTVGIAAHRDTYFRALRDVAPGDLVTLTTPDQVRSYRVATVQVVDPTDTDALADGAANRLTLVTCYPFNFVGSAPLRFVVTASEVGTPRRAAAQDLRVRPTPGPHAARSGVRLRAGRTARPRELPGSDPHPAAAQVNSAPVPKPETSRKLPWWKRLFHHRRGERDVRPPG